METRGILARVGTGDIARAILITHLLLSPLWFSSDTVEAFEFPKACLLALTAIALAALALGEELRIADCGLRIGKPTSEGQSLRERLPSWRDPLALGFLLFLASAVVSTIFSISPRLSFWGEPESHAGLITVASYTMLFFATRRWCRDARDAWQLLSAGVVGAATTSAYAVVQAIHADPIPWESLSTLDTYIRPFATMAHPNFLAGYLAMTLPLLLLFADRAWQQRNWWGLSMIVLASGAAVTALVTACSRGAWLAAGAALLGCLLGWLALGRGRRIVLSTLAALPVAVLALWLVSKFAPAGYDPLHALSLRWERLVFAGGRKEIWRIALALFGDHPLLGVGLDTFHLSFASRRTITFWAAEWNTTPIRAHNEGLQVLATQGVVGFAALLVLLGGLVGAAVRAWRTSEREGRMLALALIAGLAAFAVQDCFSFTVIGQGTLFVTLAALLSTPLTASKPAATDRAPIAFALFGGSSIFLVLLLHNIHADAARLAAGWAWGMLGVAAAAIVASVAVRKLNADDAEPGRSPKPVAREPMAFPAWMGCVAVAGGAMALAYFLVFVPLAADVACRRGDRLLTTDMVHAMEAYEEATKIAPGQPIYWAKRGIAARQGLGQLADRGARRRLAECGRDAYAQAVALVPANASYHLGLGRMQMELVRLGLARPQQALEEYDRALQIDPNNAVYYADAANAALVMEQLDAANTYTRTGLHLYPWSGILWAHLGYVAMLSHRPAEAVDHLTRSMTLSWYREVSSRQFAESMLEKARRQAKLNK